MLWCEGQDRGERGAHSRPKYGEIKGRWAPRGGTECRADEWQSILHLCQRDTHLHWNKLERFSALLKWWAFVQKSAVFAKESGEEKDKDRVVRCQALILFFKNFKGRERWRRAGKVMMKKCDNRFSPCMTPEERQVPVFVRAQRLTNTLQR